MTLADRIKALPVIKDEHGDECVSRNAVLALLASDRLSKAAEAAKQAGLELQEAEREWNSL
jgi:hypothetical protein